LKAIVLFHLMWVNADDQGRLCGDPEELKYAVCPNIDHIIKIDVPELLQELVKNKLILVYDAPRSAAVQMLDWWEVQRLQWAWPSEYPPPEGWQDRLRYKKGASTVVTQNWNAPGEKPGESPNMLQVGSDDATGDRSGEQSGKPSSFPRTPNYYPEKQTEEENGSGRGREKRNSPENSGESSGEKGSTTAPAVYPDLKILDQLTSCFKKEWGRVPAGALHEIIPREPDARETAQLRDLATELSAAGCPLDYIDQAFREAASRPDKMHISYVRAILLDWLGINRVKSP
jgi:hypothetical protein